jgi:hypothetical protein
MEMSNLGVKCGVLCLFPCIFCIHQEIDISILCICVQACVDEAEILSQAFSQNYYFYSSILT